MLHVLGVVSIQKFNLKSGLKRFGKEVEAAVKNS